MAAVPRDWPLALVLAAAVVAVVLRLARARGALEWTAVALLCATVVVTLAGRLGVPIAGSAPARGGSWLGRLGADVLLVGGLLLLARSVRRGSRVPGVRVDRLARIARAVGLPGALLGYVAREPTVFGVAGWAVTAAVWLTATLRRRP
jgi:hypothetical protein